MTIGNLPKEIRSKPSRHGQILLGYLPTTKLEHIKNADERRRTLADLFHSCMRKILAPLKTAGIGGIPMASGDGVWRRCHPLFAISVGDYPEQTLVTLAKYGTCPTCPIPPDELGTGKVLPPRDLEPILQALLKFREGIEAFEEACNDLGIKPVAHPFWEDLPYVQIYRSVTPDILHQLYQGLIKHLVAWLQEVFGAAEMDARCSRMPPNHNIRIFSKGLSVLSKVSGEEHRDICRILLGLIVDLRLPNGGSTARLVRAVRAMLDFLYLAKYPVHSDETLVLMNDALAQFHANKDIFLELGVRDDFNIPKLHNVGHYPYLITLFGTTDNYNTEFTERLHIDFAKDAYRATNKKDEYPQMTLWLERKEKVYRHDRFLQWRLNAMGAIQTHTTAVPYLQEHATTAMYPSAYSVSFDTLANSYGAYDIRNALALYIAKARYPSYSASRLQTVAATTHLPLQSLHVYNKVTFTNPDPYLRLREAPDLVDVVYAKPARPGRYGSEIPGRFDTVLVDLGKGKDLGLKGTLQQPRYASFTQYIFSQAIAQPRYAPYFHSEKVLENKYSLPISISRNA